MWFFNFLKKDKIILNNTILNDNGLNVTYYKKGNFLKERYYKKDGVRDGEYHSFYSHENSTVFIVAYYDNGLLHGECLQWSLAGGCYRFIEVYNKGKLVSRKVYFTMGDERGKIANEEFFQEYSLEIGIIQEDIERRNQL